MVGASTSMTSPAGEVIVRGAGSSWQSSSDVVIGHLSDGRLQVLDGGSTSVAGNLTVGGFQGSGTAVVDDQSRLEIIGGDLIEYRFGSWEKALGRIYSGPLSTIKYPPAFKDRKIVQDMLRQALEQYRSTHPQKGVQ